MVSCNVNVCKDHEKYLVGKTAPFRREAPDLKVYPTKGGWVKGKGGNKEEPV